MAKNILIILRGNSGSGKSTVARRLQKELGGRVAVIEQDYYQQQLLYPWDNEASKLRAELITEDTLRLLGHGYSVILDGILGAKRYRFVCEDIMRKWSGKTRVYYFSIDFEETVRRHQTRAKRHDFGKAEMCEWYKENDWLSEDDTIIGQHISEDGIVARILKDAHGVLQ